MQSKIFISISLFISISFLSGCNTVKSIPFSPQDKQAIKSIYVNPLIKKPKKISYTGNDAAVAYAAGGLILSSVVIDNNSKRLEKLTLQNNIDIRKIVYQEWIKQLEKSSSFKVHKKMPADAQLVVSISKYGVSSDGFSANYRPTLVTKATLIYQDRIVWQKGSKPLMMLNSKFFKTCKMSQIKQNPNCLRQMWQVGTAIAVRDLIADLNK